MVGVLDERANDESQRADTKNTALSLHCLLEYRPRPLQPDQSVQSLRGRFEEFVTCGKERANAS